jgi:hypothetical protein
VFPCSKNVTYETEIWLGDVLIYMVIYRVFKAEADWTLTHMSHKDTEQSTIEASITLYGVTLPDSLIR